AIVNCDLTRLGSPETTAVCETWGTGIKVNQDETPAMGPDGTLYFKDVGTQGSDKDSKRVGSIFAYTPSRKEIWRTELMFTKVSPITLSADGRTAYALADIPIQTGNQSRRIALIRMDTVTGETVAIEIRKKPDGSRPLQADNPELLRPAVAS